MFVRAGERIGAPRKDAMRLDAIEGVEENLNFGQHFTGSILPPLTIRRTQYGNQ